MANRILFAIFAVIFLTPMTAGTKSKGQGAMASSMFIQHERGKNEENREKPHPVGFIPQAGNDGRIIIGKGYREMKRNERKHKEPKKSNPSGWNVGNDARINHANEGKKKDQKKLNPIGWKEQPETKKLKKKQQEQKTSHPRGWNVGNDVKANKGNERKKGDEKKMQIDMLLNEERKAQKENVKIHSRHVCPDSQKNKEEKKCKNVNKEPKNHRPIDNHNVRQNMINKEKEKHKETKKNSHNQASIDNHNLSQNMINMERENNQHNQGLINNYDVNQNIINKEKEKHKETEKYSHNQASIEVDNVNNQVSNDRYMRELQENQENGGLKRKIVDTLSNATVNVFDTVVNQTGILQTAMKVLKPKIETKIEETAAKSWNKIFGGTNTTTNEIEKSSDGGYSTSSEEIYSTEGIDSSESYEPVTTETNEGIGSTEITNGEFFSTETANGEFLSTETANGEFFSTETANVEFPSTETAIVEFLSAETATGEFFGENSMTNDPTVSQNSS